MLLDWIWEILIIWFYNFMIIWFYNFVQDLQSGISVCGTEALTDETTQ